MLNAFRIGLSMTEWEEMTPYELDVYSVGFFERKKYEQEESISQSWLNAYLQRVEKMPTLQELLGKEEKKKEMSEAEQFNMAKQLNALFGGDYVEPKNKER